MAQLMIMPAVPPPKDATSQIMRGNVMPPVPVRMMIAAPSTPAALRCNCAVFAGSG